MRFPAAAKPLGHLVVSAVKSPWFCSMPSMNSSSTPIACAVAIVSSSSVSFELVHHQVRARFGEGGAMDSAVRSAARICGSSVVGQSV